MLKNVFAFAVLLALFGACTENDSIKPYAEHQLNLRSDTATCDSLEDNIQEAGSEPKCSDLAELLECRLNQGIEEDDVKQNCDSVTTEPLDRCINGMDILNNYESVVEDLFMEVADNTPDCNNGVCPSPHPILSCRTVIFQVRSSGIGPCNQQECWFEIDAIVYCCQ